MFDTRPRFFLTNVDQSVHINETFKSCHCIILHQDQQYINSKCGSIYSETPLLSNIRYKSNTNNFSVCQCGIQISSIISIRLHCQKMYVLNSFLGGVCTKACGFDDVFPPDSLWFSIRMLDANCVVCNTLLFLRSFNNLNVIFTYYSSVTSWCVLSGTTSVAVNGSLCKFCLCDACVNFAFLSLQSLMSNCYYNSLNVYI